MSTVGTLGGFLGPYALGTINQRTGSFRGGLVLAGISLFASAMLILALRKRTVPESDAVAITQTSLAGTPPAGMDP